MHGVGFWATRRSGPNTFTYSVRMGSSRRSRGASGKRARNSSTVIGVRAALAQSSRSRDRRIWTMAEAIVTLDAHGIARATPPTPDLAAAEGARAPYGARRQ